MEETQNPFRVGTNFLIMKKVTIGLIAIFVSLFIIILSCNKNNDKLNIENDNGIEEHYTTSNSSISLAYKDSNSNYVNISTHQFKNFLVNSNVIPNSNNTLQNIYIDSIVENNNMIYAVKSVWLDNIDQNLAYKVSVMVYPISSSSSTIFVLGNSSTTTVTTTCTCTGCANAIGCEASVSSFCQCTPCTANTSDCKKESKTVITTTTSLYI